MTCQLLNAIISCSGSTEWLHVLLLLSHCGIAYLALSNAKDLISDGFEGALFIISLAALALVLIVMLLIELNRTNAQRYKSALRACEFTYVIVFFYPAAQLVKNSLVVAGRFSHLPPLLAWYLATATVLSLQSMTHIEARFKIIYALLVSAYFQLAVLLYADEEFTAEILIMSILILVAQLGALRSGLAPARLTHPPCNAEHEPPKQQKSQQSIKFVLQQQQQQPKKSPPRDSPADQKPGCTHLEKMTPSAGEGQQRSMAPSQREKRGVESAEPPESDAKKPEPSIQFIFPCESPSKVIKKSLVKSSSSRRESNVCNQQFIAPSFCTKAA